MPYDLSKNDRFFLNQLIPKWETGKPFDLKGDLKFVFHREQGLSYNEAQYEYTLITLKAFLEENKFAKETREYVFELQPKANMLMVKGTIELFEDYQEREKAGLASPLRPVTNAHADAARRRNEAMKMAAHESPPRRSNATMLLLFALCVIIVIGVIAWQFISES